MLDSFVRLPHGIYLSAFRRASDAETGDAIPRRHNRDTRMTPISKTRHGKLAGAKISKGIDINSQQKRHPDANECVMSQDLENHPQRDPAPDQPS
jgi:hypothetical protein